MNSHNQLFSDYVSDLNESTKDALLWWYEIIERESIEVEGADDALLRVLRRWPFGPASFPYVIATYIKYFLACERLNEELAKAQINAEHGRNIILEDDWGMYDNINEYSSIVGPVPASVLLVDCLRGQHDELYQFLSWMVFNPVGIDPSTGRLI